MNFLLILSFVVLASAAQANPIYTLYTQENSSPQTLVLNDADSVANSNFLSSRPTRFVTHGWRGDDSTSAVTDVRDAYLAVEDSNIIVANWNNMQSIFSSTHNTATNVGTAMAEFLTFMQSSAGLDLTTTTLIGHSLGAHVIAVAARALPKTPLALVALDPAGTSDWETAATGIALGVQSGDASHVQVIHTNGGGMGLWRVSGDSDFYVNGGKSQPGCILDLFGICAHFRAADYFAESIRNPVGFPSAEDSTVFLGGVTLSSHAKGSYSLTTNSRSPYAQGA